MGTINTDTFAIRQATYALPDDFLVTEARPSMLSRLGDELLGRATTWRDKERLASDRVVICDLSLIAFKS